MNPNSQEVKKLAIVISSGTGTGTLSSPWQIARWIRVQPVAETDSFDVTFKDGEGAVMLVRTGQVGSMCEKLEMSLGIIKTILIANTTQDGTYTVRFDCH